MRWSYDFVFVRAFVRVCKTKTRLGLPQRPLFNNNLKSPSLKNSNLTCWQNYASQFKRTKPNDSDVTCYDSTVTEAKTDVSYSGQLMYIARLTHRPYHPHLSDTNTVDTLFKKKKKKIRHKWGDTSSWSSIKWKRPGVFLVWRFLELTRPESLKMRV